MQKPSAQIDRRKAGKMLGVSVRTIDRYIRRGKLAAHTRSGRIWLMKKEVEHFREGERVPIRIVTKPRPDVIARPQVSRTAPPDFYHDLFLETQRALRDCQQKLEQANYRIGQLESQILREPMPAPKIIERREESSQNPLYERELLDREKELSVLRELAKKEKSNRFVFAFLTYLLLVLQPIFWYLFHS